MTKARDIASAAPAPSTVSATELGYLDGVTSAIQTQVDAKIPKTLTTTTGDIIYASSANTPARLGIGSTSQVLTVSGGVPSWATPASGGGWTSLASGSLSGASVSVNITTTGYYQVIAFVKSAVCNTDWYLAFDLNTDSGSNYSFINQYSSSSTAVTSAGRDATTSFFVDKGLRNGDIGNAVYVVNNPANTTAHKMVTGICSGRETGNSYYVNGQFLGRYMSNSAITNIRFLNGGSSFTGGTYEIYGVK